MFQQSKAGVQGNLCLDRQSGAPDNWGHAIVKALSQKPRVEKAKNILFNPVQCILQQNFKVLQCAMVRKLNPATRVVLVFFVCQ